MPAVRSPAVLPLYKLEDDLIIPPNSPAPPTPTRPDLVLLCPSRSMLPYLGPSDAASTGATLKEPGDLLCISCAITASSYKRSAGPGLSTEELLPVANASEPWPLSFCFRLVLNTFSFSPAKKPLFFFFASLCRPVPLAYLPWLGSVASLPCS